MKCLNMDAEWRVEAVLAYRMAQMLVAYKVEICKKLGEPGNIPFL